MIALLAVAAMLLCGRGVRGRGCGGGCGSRRRWPGGHRCRRRDGRRRSRSGLGWWFRRRCGWRECRELEGPAGIDPVRVGEGAAVGLRVALVEFVDLGPAEGIAEVLLGDVPEGVAWLHDIGR